MIEEWKEIPKTEGLYEASTFGRIRSLDRVIVRMNRWGFIGEVKKKGRVLSPWHDKNGYEVVYIAYPGRREAINVHRLIAKTFLKDDGNGLDTNHIDGIKTNNCPDNLEWCTRKENMAHALSMGLIKRAKRICGVPIHGGPEIVFESAGAAAQSIGKPISASAYIWMAANGKARQAYGYFWKYQTI